MRSDDDHDNDGSQRDTMHDGHWWQDQSGSPFSLWLLIVLCSQVEQFGLMICWLQQLLLIHHVLESRLWSVGTNNNLSCLEQMLIIQVKQYLQKNRFIWMCASKCGSVWNHRGSDSTVLGREEKWKIVKQKYLINISVCISESGYRMFLQLI